MADPSSGYLIAVKDNRRLIMEYCAALNMPAALCDRVSGLVFAENGSGERSWDAGHPQGAVPGDSLSVASPMVGLGDYSCMSVYFSEPIAAGSDISFQWSLGRGADGDSNSSSTLLVWFAPTAEQPPMIDLGSPRILQDQDGFSAWMEHLAVAIDRPVPEIRWCYFGASTNPGEMDIGRIDRLEVFEGSRIRFVLPEPNPGPAIVEGTTAVVLVRSTVAFADGDRVLVRLLVEEGERFIDPNGPNVVAEVSTLGRLVLELPLVGDGNTLEHALMLPTRADNRPRSEGNIRLALVAPQPGVGYRVSTPSSGYLVAVQDSRHLITEYCDALNMQVDLCARLSNVVFANSSTENSSWDAGHPEGAVPGDSLSVASPSVGDGDYSCLILNFSEPIAAGSDISFQWSLGRGAGGDSNSSSTLLVWLGPAADEQPPMIDLGPPRISQDQDEFSDWMEHSAMAIDRAVPEIRWCYFGANPSPGEMDIGRIDRLEVFEGSRIRFVLPEPNPGPAIVEGATAVVLVRSTVAFAAGDRVLVRLLVAEGERFIDPNGINVVAEVSLPGRLVLELPLVGDGTTLEHALMLPTRADNRPRSEGNIRLALVEPQPGVGYRVSTPSSGYLVAVQDSRHLITEYCDALNMQVDLCARLSSVVFANSSTENRSWNAGHPEGALPGDSLSVASPSVGDGDYSCLSLNFSEPIVAGSDISFQWSLGRGAGGDSSSTLLVWLGPAADEQLPMLTLGQPGILRGQEGVSDWMEYSAMAIDRPVPEIRWCYFGGSPSPGEMDIGRIDRLEVFEGSRIRFVLPEPNPGPAVVEGTTASVIVRSEVAVEAGRTVSVRLLVAEGERFIDPSGPNVLAEVSTAGRLVLELPLTGDGTTLEHALMLPIRDDNRLAMVSTIRLSLPAPPPGARYRVGTPSSGYLIAVKDNRRLIMEYCAALNMPAVLCDRVSGIVFAENGSGERSWDAGHPLGAVPGDSLSVASPMVGLGDYSCMSMHFSEPIAAGSDISFQWSLGRGAGGDSNSSSTLLVWLGPTGADQPPMVALGQPGISRGQEGFSDWMEHLAVAIDRPIPEIRWCYFGANPSPDHQDIGRIDRLVVAEGIALGFVLPDPNPGPAIVEGTTASISVRSTVAFADGDSVMIRLLVEDGERFIDLDCPNVLAEVSISGRLVLELPLVGDGNTLEHALMLPTRADNRPELGGNIRLALAEPLPAAGYRLGTPSGGYLIAVKDNRRQIMDYCAALNMPAALCSRVSSIIFANSSTENRSWDAGHPAGALPGDSLSVASPSVGAGDYSCLSMHFSEPIAAGSDISFQWSLGRGAGGDSNSSSTLLVWFAPAADEQPPMLTLGQPGILRGQAGFSDWMEHSAMAIDRPVPAIRWCYFGGSPSPGEMDIGRIDRLVVTEGIALSFVLPQPNPGPAIVEGTTAVVLVRSTVAFADGDSVLIRLLVEDGSRFIDLDGPNVVADVSTPAQLVLQYTLTGDGNALEHALMLPTRADNRPEPGGNIRLVLAAPLPAADYRVSTPSSGYLIAVKDNRLQIMDYCAALNMPAVLCDRVSGIVFAENGSEERAWDAGHPAGAVPGDSLSVASPSVGAGDYSCMSMHFSEPIVAGSDISFQWSLGRGAGGDSSSTLLVWLGPAADEQLPMLTLGQPGILRGQAGFSDWMEYSAMAIDRPVPEIRWCYFGGSPSPGEMDIGRIDRLEVFEGSRIRFVLPQPNPGPAVVEGTTASVIVRSEVAVEAGRTVSVRLLVEEGERFIDPSGPNVLAEVSTPGRLVLELPLTGDGTTLEHALMLPIRDDNRLAMVSTIRLSLPAPPPGARYRVGTPSSGYLIAVKDNRRLIMEYCAALNMPAVLCDRVSGIVFAENGSGERSWEAGHPQGAVPGDSLSVASPMVGLGDYSCMSMYFSEPIAAGSDISFQWSLGRGAGGDSNSSSTLLVWLGPTGADQPPMVALGQPGISRGQEGFSDWMEHSAMAINRPIPEIRWCYFGANPSPDHQDIGRIDRLVVAEGIALSFVLPDPNPGPAIVEGTTASISVRSTVAFADGDSVMIRLLVEDGERFIDLDGPNVLAEVSISEQLVLEFSLTGDGNTLEHVLMLPTRDDNRPELGGNIRLVLAEPLPAAGYRVNAPSSGYLIAVKDNRRQIVDYCAALNMPAALCSRVSSIIFANSSTENRSWDAGHPVGAVPGDSLSVASPSVGAGDYSCLSMHFSEPIAAGSDISFQWSLGRGAGGDSNSSSTLLVWFAPAADEQPPMLTLGQPGILRGQAGFSDWMEHSAMAIDRPVPEIRWCYFGGSPSPGEMDIGRIDRLVVTEGIALSFVLPQPNPGPAIVEGTTAVILVRSTVAFADGDSVLIRLLVEDGSRFIDLAGPNVVADVSTPAQLVLQYTLTGDGNALEHALMLPTRADNRPEPGGNIRLVLAAPLPAAGYRLSTPSSGYLIAVKDNRLQIMDYCAALNMPAVLCDRVSGIVFAENGSEERAWDAGHPAGAVPGDSLSVASPSVGAGDYSCMSMHFSEPIVAGSDISFQWSLGRGAGGDSNSSSTLLVWFAPAADEQLPMLTLGQPGILRGQEGVSDWMEYSAMAIDRPVPAIRWCYFGGSPSPGEMDIGRIDRLEVTEGGRIRFVLPQPNPGPAVFKGLPAAIVVRSEVAVEAGRMVSIRLLVEEGNRFIDLDGPNVVAEVSTPGRLVLELPLTGDGSTLEHVLMLPIQIDDLAVPGGNIRLALAEPPPGAGYRLGTPSSGYLVAVRDNDFRPDAEGLIRWWQLLRQCEMSGNCPTPNGSAPTLTNSQGLAVRTEDELEDISAMFQAMLDNGILNVNGDEANDTMDLRIILRYLAGLRGGALVESGTADEARLQALMR